ncbi:MAG: MBL fold metallo-hydrolase [Prevotellaceae bacterium]|jgi:phosphoribosyl 1,2-cyclic phosphodiesterase|nr:MBL fold metallo-hydrolase [Prevotellaceae bacterium]
MKIKFISLASGSSGNCYYIGTETYGILVDAGIPVRSIKKKLKEAGIEMERIRAVFITHDHTDHIKGVGGLGEKLNIPVYATKLVHEGISRCHCVTDHLLTSACYLRKEEPVQVADFCVEAFEVPHDGTDNVGYCIEIDGRAFVFLTDLGKITPTAARFIQRANYLILEANYDIDMLQQGSYPRYLKERISSGIGHLSNRAAAECLADHFPPDLQAVWLCHLSKDNNHPDLAYKTVEEHLKERGIIVGKDVQLCALKRNTSSEPYLFDTNT